MDVLSAVHSSRCVVFMKGAQVGASLAIDTPIPTAEGWATMGALLVGDTLFDETDTSGQVTGVSPIMIGRPYFEITFEDDIRLLCTAFTSGTANWRIGY